MALINRSTLTTVHTLLAAFIFPVAVMFLVTGGLYTWDFKGDYETSSTTISLEAPLHEDAEQLRVLVEKQLRQMNLPLPSGEAKIKRGGLSYKFEWTGADYDVVLEPTNNPLEAKLQVKDTSWYRRFVQLHKAKGGQAFKVYAAILAVSLFVILSTGFLMAFQVPKYRRLAVTAAVCGIAIFIAMLLSS